MHMVTSSVRLGLAFTSRSLIEESADIREGRGHRTREQHRQRVDQGLPEPCGPG